MLFDVDETLVDRDGAARNAIIDHLTELGLPAGPEALERWVRLEDLHYGRYLAGELSFTDQRRERARAMAGLALSDEEADRWLAGYIRRFEAAWRAFPDVGSVLDALSGLRLGVVTNLDVVHQSTKLETVGLSHRFRCLVGPDTVGVPKPAPQIFHAACAALGVRPREAAYVGDRLDVDALGATRAGLFGVWLDRRGPCRVPGRVPGRGYGRLRDLRRDWHDASRDRVPTIRSLRELPKLLARRRGSVCPDVYT
ncbi:MAG: HAD family hydrolase [Carbonactinosporaceae bacterium]